MVYYKEALTIALVAGGMAAGGGGATAYFVRDTGQKEVRAEVTVQVDEVKVGGIVADRLIAHNEQKEEYEQKLAQRKGCLRNSDNKYYINEHCKGVDF